MIGTDLPVEVVRMKPIQSVPGRVIYLSLFVATARLITQTDSVFFYVATVGHEISVGDVMCIQRNILTTTHPALVSVSGKYCGPECLTYLLFLLRHFSPSSF